VHLHAGPRGGAASAPPQPRRLEIGGRLRLGTRRSRRGGWLADPLQLPPATVSTRPVTRLLPAHLVASPSPVRASVILVVVATVGIVVVSVKVAVALSRTGSLVTFPTPVSLLVPASASIEPSLVPRIPQVAFGFPHWRRRVIPDASLFVLSFASLAYVPRPPRIPSTNDIAASAASRPTLPGHPATSHYSAPCNAHDISFCRPFPPSLASRRPPAAALQVFSAASCPCATVTVFHRGARLCYRVVQARIDGSAPSWLLPPVTAFSPQATWPAAPSLPLRRLQH
jgi:hypothetical protein